MVRAVKEITHSVETGINSREREFAIVRIERDLGDDGAVQMVWRKVVDWLPSKSIAEAKARRLNRQKEG